MLVGVGFDNGAWVAPTVFTDCSDDMTIVREEIFGPVMSILTYESEDEVIRRANDTDYGLAAGIVTADLNRAHRVIHQLEAGICWINTWGESPAEMPVGGYKHSGIGRENGVMTLQSSWNSTVRASPPCRWPTVPPSATWALSDSRHRCAEDRKSVV